MSDLGLPSAGVRGNAFSAVCIWCAVVLLLFFYGAQINLIVLASAASLLLMAVYLVIGTAFFSRFEIGIVFLYVVLLVVAQMFSPSPESSFPAAWVLGLMPLGYVLGHALAQAGRVAWQGILFILLAAGLFSLWNLLAYGERPSLPLTDSNNFAALMYVTVLILACSIVASRGVHQRAPAGWVGLVVIALLVLLVSATGSRAGLLVLTGGGLCLIAMCIRSPAYRFDVVAVLIAGVVGVLSHDFLLDRSDASAPGAETLTGGLEIRRTLIEAAWSMRDANPLAGIGPFIFPLRYRQIRGPEDPDTAGLFVHNDYVQLAVEVGPLILVPFVVLGVVVGRLVVSTLVKRRGVEAADAGDNTSGSDLRELGYAMALIGLMVHAALNFVYYTAVLSLLAGLLGARVVSVSSSQPENIPVSGGRLILWPALGFSFIALAYLWLDVATGAILQGQPGAGITRRISENPMLQLRYARLAQGLNPDRGTPYLAEALITNQMGGGADDPGSAARSLHTWRRAMSADPWNTHGFWSFREFLLANPGVADQLRADERPATLVDRMLELDPVFIPAIEATLMDIGVDSSPRTRTKQAEFLDRHLDGRMHWMARENREAAIAYAGFLAAYAPAPDRQEYWQQVGREVEAIQPLVEKRLLF